MADQDHMASRDLEQASEAGQGNPTLADIDAARELADRLRGKYRIGPMLPNGEPEFGYRQFDNILGKPFPAIHGEAATMIDRLVGWITHPNPPEPDA